MALEEKDLLITDLCGRLFYWPRITNDDDDISYIVGVENSKEATFITHVVEDGDDYDCVKNINDFKPYLRPMSSMTEEEKVEWEGLKKEVKKRFWIDRLIDFYLSHHFDYRGLIPMKLALEAPKGMYKTE